MRSASMLCVYEWGSPVWRSILDGVGGIMLWWCIFTWCCRCSPMVFRSWNCIPSISSPLKSWCSFLAISSTLGKSVSMAVCWLCTSSSWPVESKSDGKSSCMSLKLKKFEKSSPGTAAGSWMEDHGEGASELIVHRSRVWISGYVIEGWYWQGGDGSRPKREVVVTGVLTMPAKVWVVNSSSWRSSPRVGRRREDIKSNVFARFSGMRRSLF